MAENNDWKNKGFYLGYKKIYYVSVGLYVSVKNGYK